MMLVMYDLDGTLLDTASEITEAVNRTLCEFNLESVTEEDVRIWIGHGTGWLMERAWEKKLGSKSIPWPKVMERFTEHYEATAGTSSTAFPKVIETLNKVQSMGILQAIITNKETKFTKKVLEKHHLQNFFKLVVCGDTLTVKKPNPQVIKHCIQTLSIPAPKSLFVGDSEIDIATAKAAGIVCWAVPYGYNHGRPIAMANPDRLVPDISDIPNYFRGIQ